MHLSASKEEGGGFGVEIACNEIDEHRIGGRVFPGKVGVSQWLRRVGGKKDCGMLVRRNRGDWFFCDFFPKEKNFPRETEKQ